MNVTERNDLIKIFIRDYIWKKKDDRTWQREPSSEQIYNRGKLIGLLTACELDMEEDEAGITVKTQGSGRTVLRYDFKDL